MTTVKQAAEKAINLGKQLQAIIDVGEVLDQIGNLEEAKREASDLKKKAETDHFEAASALKILRDKVHDAEHYLQQTKNEAVKTLDDVNIARDNLFATAKEEAQNIVKAATDGANIAIKQGEKDVKVLTDQREELLKESEQLSVDLGVLRYEMGQLRQRLG